MILTENDLITDITLDTPAVNPLEAKVRSMFELQNELNTLINSEWAVQPDWDFQRATMVELVELMDHYGYKWWKKQEPHMDQCVLEVIDIAHFHISHLMQQSIRNECKFDYYVSEFTTDLITEEYEVTADSIRKLIDECVFLASSKNFSTKALALLMYVFNLTPDQLCEKYILKNTLNIFRANNGYNKGTYIKQWNGKEDNEVLMEIYETLDKNSVTLADDLYYKLQAIYETL